MRRRGPRAQLDYAPGGGYIPRIVFANAVGALRALLAAGFQPPACARARQRRRPRRRQAGVVNQKITSGPKGNAQYPHYYASTELVAGAMRRALKIFGKPAVEKGAAAGEVAASAAEPETAAKDEL